MRPGLRALARIPSERELQRQIVDGLRRCGYEVLETGAWARRAYCQACGATFVPKTGQANTVGTPDLFVTRSGGTTGVPRSTEGVPSAGTPSGTSGRGRNLWVALEVKRPRVKTLLGTVEGGRLSSEQRGLVEAGIVSVVHSLEEALNVLEEAGL